MLESLNINQSALKSIEELCLKLIYSGWLDKKETDEMLARLGETPASLQHRLKSVGFDLFIITIPSELSAIQDGGESYVVIPRIGIQLVETETAILAVFIGIVLFKNRPLTRLEMSAIFGKHFSNELRSLIQKRLILRVDQSTTEYTFSPLAKAIFHENFDKIRDILKRLITFSVT